MSKELADPRAVMIWLSIKAKMEKLINWSVRAII
jgi:hypothetical protein